MSTFLSEATNLPSCTFYFEATSLELRSVRSGVFYIFCGCGSCDWRAWLFMAIRGRRKASCGTVFTGKARELATVRWRVRALESRRAKPLALSGGYEQRGRGFASV